MSDRNEAETRAELIDPALKEAGWGEVDGSRIRREMIAPGRILGGGKRSAESVADYVLVYKNQKMAVVEAKREGLEVSEGLGQAKRDSQRLQTPFAYSTNGLGIYQVDMRSATEGDVDRYLTPEEMWQTVYGDAEAKEETWSDRFSAIPFEDKGGQWQPRYYQHNAITRAMDAIGRQQDRILLTLATGTGKTAIAFQIAWKLFHSRWNLTDWRAGLDEGQAPTRRPRILFLADRNILANQAFNAFSAFPEDALVRIDPSSIRKKGRVPKNGSVFFTIFQTFMSGRDTDGNPQPSFGDYPPDFFDLIVIDECHRGGANDESNWRGILEYFEPAVQLGLTATPRRDTNADTYDYFGDPVYIYSLKEGINDGYLTPFRVQQIQTTLDDYVYVSDDMVMEGEVEEGKRYGEDDFNRIIEIQERERKRVEIFMNAIDQNQKTLVFCATQDHALAVRDLINQMKSSTHADYCVRVTANDGDLGEKHLKVFQDNEKTIPTILTTSQKLSTGVDARNIRNIVLMRPINSMIEFKQIIGRGTRIYEGKEYFTIYDFVRAHEHFNDPEWDGEPEAPVPTEPRAPRPEGDGEGPEPDDSEATERPRKLKIQLADGKERTIQHMTSTSFWNPDGTPMSATEFIQQLFGEIPSLFTDEEQLRQLWSAPDTRRKLLEGLEEKGFGSEQLADLAKIIKAEKSDLFDVLGYIAFTSPPKSREERVAARKTGILSLYAGPQQEFLQFVLDQYVESGIKALDDQVLPELIDLKYHTVHDAKAELGEMRDIRDLFIGFQKHLYQKEQVA